MTPPELLLASLGNLCGILRRPISESAPSPARGLRIRTTAEKVQAPARLDNIRVELEYPETFDVRKRAGVLSAVHKCLIHNTLLHSPRITVDVQVRLPAAA